MTDDDYDEGEQTVRWFGEPWPSATKRAAVCDDDRYRVDVPVGVKCAGCDNPLAADDQGVTIPAVTRVAPGPAGFEVTRNAYHLSCILATIGV